MTIGAYDQDDRLILETIEDRLPRIRISRPSDVSVVLGRGSKEEVEVDQEAIAADGVPLLRRRGGGCAVVLDPGNVIVSVILPTDGIGGSKTAFANISTWLIQALAAIGIDSVCQKGISDLTRHGRKVGGSCIHQTNRVLYYTTTLLLTPNLAAVERYLHHPPREPDYRLGRGHHDFMGRLLDALPVTDLDLFALELGHRLQRAGIPEVPGLDPNGDPVWYLPTNDALHHHATAHHLEPIHADQLDNGG